MRRRIKYCILVVLVIMIGLHLHLGYFCVETGCVVANGDAIGDDGALRHQNLGNDPWEQRLGKRVVLETRPRAICLHGERHEEPISGSFMLQNHTFLPINLGYTFDTEGDQDVLVFLHIQKTGGTTFGRHLVTDLDLQTPCLCLENKRKCECRNAKDKVWLVSRYSTGWRCGLHADWTELSQCVDAMLDRVEGADRYRRYLYMTILRDPYSRYISEFKHVQRGATWKAARLQCDGRQASLEEVPFCFEGSDWAGVALDNFTDCPHNLANNRQVRMLANLSLSNCYRRDVITKETRDCIMLKSAKQNLRQMAFFGLTEYQSETQYLFEETFGMKFRNDFFQYNHTHSTEIDISTLQQRQILHLKKLDIQLYEYAKVIFFKRLRSVIKGDKHLNGHHNHDYHGASKGLLHSNYNHVIGGNARPNHYDSEEGDENDAEDDDEFNHRIHVSSKRLFSIDGSRKMK